jgi:hypothetical protein
MQLTCSRKNFWRRCRGDIIKTYQVPLHKLSFTCSSFYLPFYLHLPLVFISPTSHKKIQKHKNIYVRSFACFIAMSQETTKLCDFSNTNNNDFISTPIAPSATSAESYDINVALLNLVIKEQFSGTPNEDAASHLNTFVELCDMQKKKDVDNDIIKFKLIPFSLRDRAKT